MPIIPVGAIKLNAVGGGAAFAAGGEPDREALERELMKVEQYVEMVLHYQRLEGDGKDLVLREYPLERIGQSGPEKVALLFIYKRIQLLGES